MEEEKLWHDVGNYENKAAVIEKVGEGWKNLVSVAFVN